MADAEYFSLTFRLKTESWQEDIIDKRLEAGRHLYNSLLRKTLKMWKEVRKTRRYRDLVASLDHDKDHPEHDKPISKEIDQLRIDAGFSENGFMKLMTPMRKPFSHLVGGAQAQKIAKHIWRAWRDYFFGQGKSVHYRKYGDFKSLEEQSNKCGIRFILDKKICLWYGLAIPVDMDKLNYFEKESMTRHISFCRAAKGYVKGKRKYYLQIFFRGSRPNKISPKNWEIESIYWFRRCRDRHWSLDCGLRIVKRGRHQRTRR